MKTLWVTGAGGTVGTRIVASAQGEYDQIHAFAHHLTTPTPGGADTEWHTLDLGDSAALAAAAAAYPPDVIINAAAMTNVDGCETDRAGAARANIYGPRHLAEVARARGAHLLHISTDYVFPGDADHPGPYQEDDAPRPISYYGLTKLAGEVGLMATCAEGTPYTIARTALVYGTGKRANFINWLARELRAGRRVRIVQDQYNTPTIADDLALVLLWMARQRRTGIYHVAGPDRVGRHEWAQAIVSRFGLDGNLVDLVTTAELAQVAPRPLQSGLACDKLAQDEASDKPRLRGIEQGLYEIDWDREAAATA